MSLVFSLFSEEIPVHFQNSAKVFRVSVEEKFRWISRDKLFTKAQDVPWVLVEKHFDDFSTLSTISTIFGHFHHTLFYFHTFTFTFTWVLVGKNYDSFSTLFTFFTLLSSLWTLFSNFPGLLTIWYINFDMSWNHKRESIFYFHERIGKLRLNTLPTATLLAGKANLSGTEAQTKWKFPVGIENAQASASNVQEHWNHNNSKR